jgi:hypothetical protein
MQYVTPLELWRMKKAASVSQVLTARLFSFA